MSWFEVSRTKEDEGGKEAREGGKGAEERAKGAAKAVMFTTGASLAREGSVDVLAITMSRSYWRRGPIRR